MPPKPDLTVESVTWDPANPRRLATVTIKNRGDAPAIPPSNGYTTTFQSIQEDGDITEVTTGSNLGRISQTIQPGDTYTITVIAVGIPNWPIVPSSNRGFRVTVDRSNVVAESNDNNNSRDAVPLDEQTTAEDLINADDHTDSLPDRPLFLPGNPLHIFTTARRNIQILTTFNSQARVELELQHASERLAESEALVERGNADRAIRHLENYNQSIERASIFVDRLQRRDGIAGNQAGSGLIRTVIQHQHVLNRIERSVPETKASELSLTKNKSLEKISNVIDAIDNDELVLEALSSAISNNGSVLKPLRNLEVLKSMEEKVSEKARNIIKAIEQDQIKTLNAQLENTPLLKKEIFSDYVIKSGGNEISYLKGLSEIKSAKPETKDKFLETEEKLLEKVDNKIEKFDNHEQEFIDSLNKAIKNDKNLESTVIKLRPEIIKKISDKIEQKEAAKTKSLPPISENPEIDRLRSQCSEGLESLRKDTDKLYRELFGGSQSQVSPGHLLAYPIVNHNVGSLNALKDLNSTNEQLSKSFQRLSSSLRQSRAGDDAAGLAVSERLNAQIRVLDQAVLNLKETTPSTDTCEKEINEMRSILGELKVVYRKTIKKSSPAPIPIIKTTSTPAPIKTFSPTPVPIKETAPTLTPTPTLSTSSSPSPQASSGPTPTASATPAPTKSSTPTPTPIETKSSTPTPSVLPTPKISDTPTPAPEPTKSTTPTPMPTPIVIKPTISSFIASPTSITLKQSATLSWDVSGADSLILSNTKETLTSSGKKTVTPTATTTYTITAANKAGSANASVTVTVK